ncbi:alpha/beta hydrolase [Alcaligenaceae bacterium SJ-26]|nr:alpha/beta hydrolase [Alcaligenaceae bacterium SJ-26]
MSETQARTPFRDVQVWHEQAPDGIHAWEVRVGVPHAPPPPEGYPVLFMLDGNAVFDILAGQNVVPDVLVVGLGYQTALTDPRVARAYDYTPALWSDRANFDPRIPERRAGGADLFLDWVQGTVRPRLARHFSVHAHRQGLYGHSYGGLFTLHALFDRPAAFDRHIAVSPSVWWNDQYILSRAAAFATRCLTPGGEATLPKGWVRQPHRLYLAAGGQEQWRPKPAEFVAGQMQARPEGIPTLPIIRDMGQMLAGVPGLAVDFRGFPECDHRAMLHASVPYALGCMLDW